MRLEWIGVGSRYFRQCRWEDEEDKQSVDEHVRYHIQNRMDQSSRREEQSSDGAAICEHTSIVIELTHSTSGWMSRASQHQGEQQQ